MAIEFAVVSDTLPSVTGTKDFTSSGFGTPTGYMIIVGNANTTNNPQAGVVYSVGACDLTNQWCVATQFEDGVGTTDNHRSQSNADVIYINDGATTLYEANHDSTVTDGVRINVTVENTTVSRYVSVVLIKGTTNIKALAYQLGTGTSYDINTIGFKPDFLMLRTIGLNSAIKADAGEGVLGFGFAHNSSTDTVTQCYAGISSPNSLSSSKTATTVRNDACIGQLFNDLQTWRGSASAFDADGFTLTTNTNPGSDGIFILAIEAPDPDDISVSIESSPTSTGTYSITTPGFAPNFGMLIQTMVNTVNTIETDHDGGALSVGFFDNTVEINIGIVEQDNAGTTNNESYADTANAINLKKWGGSSFDTMYQGSFTSFGANGPTFNISTEADTVARQWINVSFKSGAAPSFNPFWIANRNETIGYMQ